MNVHRGLGQFSEAICFHQLALVPLTVIDILSKTVYTIGVLNFKTIYDIGKFSVFVSLSQKLESATS